MEKTAFFGIFLRKEGLNQEIAPRKLVLEFNFMDNGFDTDEVAVLDSTDIVDEYTTDCGVMVIKEMMEELD